MGLTAARREEWTPAAVCFQACARLISFFFAHPTGNGGTAADASFRLYQHRNVSAMLLTGASLLQILKEQCGADNIGHPSAAPKNTSALIAQTRSALAKQQQTVEALLLADDADSILLSTWRNHGFILQHELSCLSGDSSTELMILQKANDLTFTCSDVISMAECSASTGSAGAAARGFDIALTMLLAAPQRDTPAIASVIRHRIEIEERAAAGGRTEKLGELYASAASHMSLLAETYPPDEAAWILTTAFNRGVNHHRMLRFSQAQTYFEIARSILPHTIRSDPSLERLQNRIEEAINIVNEELVKRNPTTFPNSAE